MSLTQYEHGKATGIPWLGVVPAHWSFTKTKYVGEFSVGWTPPTGHADSYEGENLWANISDLGPRKLCNTGKRISDAAVVTSGIPLSKKGSLLFSFKLSIGQVSFAGVDLYTNEAIATFQGSSKLDIRYAYFAYPIFLVQNASTNIYGAKLLNQELIRSAVFAIPPLAEQSTIATFLDRETAKIDALIFEQEKLITLLAEKRQATISHAVTKGLNPNAPMKDSGVEWLGEVPDGWEVTRLKRVATVQTGIAKGKDNAEKTTVEVPYLRVANVQDGYLKLDDIAMIEIAVDAVPRYRLQPGDVLMNEGGDFDKLGRGHIWRGEIENCIHQNHVFAVRPTSISSEWLNTVTSSDYAQFYFMTRSKQSTNLASISSSNIMELPLVLPPKIEQQSILRFVDMEKARLDALTEEATRGIVLLKERRSALISAAVTGKIDVRQAVHQKQSKIQEAA